tara:strand:+ start:67 stop:1392 length:1326 start_codon:yes stop_codon:yes gene_type:complete
MRNNFFKLISILILISVNSFAAEITYKEILDNPTDLELNLNYAKQQESSGNLKLTISTLERLSMLYPTSTDIKLYLLSILIKMDSKVKVDLLVRTMMNDPNTSIETRKLIAELLTQSDQEKKEPSKWFAYLDLKYSQTEESNISGITKTKKLLQEGTKVDFTKVDSKFVVEYDKAYTRGSSLTVGKNIDKSSSVFFNLGLDINTINKKKKGDSDIISSSVSYFKVIDNHYISPYIYLSKPNYRRQEDYNTRGFGINNTFIINEKNNINYGLAYADTSYDVNSHFDTAADNDNGTYSSFIRYNYNFTNKSQLGTKFILNRIESKKEFDSFDSKGISLVYSHVLPFGTLKFKSTYLENDYDEAEEFVDSSLIRTDESLVTSLSLDGQLNQIFPFLKKFNKLNGIFYTLNMRQSDVSSNVLNHDVERNYKTIGLTKRINLNGLF